MRGLSRPELVDTLVAAGFVVAAGAEAVVQHHGNPGQQVFGVCGALWLAALALRRRRPVLALAVIAAGGTIGSVVGSVVWPASSDDAGAWIVGLLLACYSLGSHARGRVVWLGVALPALVVVSADVTTRTGWSRVSGILFVSLLIGLLPTAAGRLVRVRRERLETLVGIRGQILRAQRERREAAVLTERLQAAERWQPLLVEGLRDLAAVGDPAQVETRARELLARTREEVVALTTPVQESSLAPGPVEPDVSPGDHLTTLREAAQPWSVLAATALVAGLVAETWTSESARPGWALLVGVLVGAPVALVWWRPVFAVALAWVAVTLFARGITPLDGSLSEAAFALAASFAVAALSRRTTAALGLVVCLAGQVMGVGGDPGEVVLLLLAWLGGMAVCEATQLVEQTRANNDLLAREQGADAARAVVEERLHLAREVHYAVGHSLTVIALQAGAARRLAGRDPARARQVMGTVAAVARSGVASLSFQEPPGDLEALLAQVHRAGLSLDCDLRDEPGLDPGQRRVAFRVVQEALTNVLRHAPGATAEVSVRRIGDHAQPPGPGPGSVEVVVANSPPSGPGAGLGSGHGLPGMRERVEAIGGEVSWGHRGDGCFEVRAILPVTAHEAAPAKVSTV